MEIIQERLEREFDIEVVQTAPTVTYEVMMTDGTIKRIDAPSELPDLTHVEEIREPIIQMNLIVPADCVGAIMKLCEDRRGTYKKTEYIGATRVILDYEIPLAEIIYDFYDKLKSATRGYGTMDYDFIGFRAGDLVKLDILVNGDRVDALSRHRPPRQGRSPRPEAADPPASRRSPATCSRSRSRRPSAARSSPARPSRPSARTSPPSATAATSPASASCWRSRRKARSA